MELTEKQKAKWRAHIEKMEVSERKKPALSNRNTEDLIAFFFLLASKGRYYGNAKLSSLMKNVDDEYAKMGLKMLVNGVDSVHIEKTMKIMKRSLMTEMEKRLDLMRHAIVSISEGTNAYLLKDECEAFFCK
jgi:flagellar motor component MotA